jgi:hypothetical protein
VIETLPLLTPNAERSARTIAGCHARLARRRKRIEAVKHANTTYLAVERAFIGGLCVIYMSAVVLVAIRMLSGG